MEKALARTLDRDQSGRMDQRERSAEVVRRFYDGWNGGQIDFEALVADDIVNHQPDVEPEQGRQLFTTAVQGVMAAVPDSRWTISDLLVDGDRVAVRITWAGSYGPGLFRGLQVEDRRAFAVEHVHIYRLAEGQLAEHWVVRDDLAMLRQLGALRS
jgi:predicted ester cyclase